MCPNITRNCHAKRISVSLTALHLLGFTPVLYWLLEQKHSRWQILGTYIGVLVHCVANIVLYNCSKQRSRKSCYILLWLIFYFVEFSVLFVFGIYCAYSALTWPARGWPEYYINHPIVLSTASITVASIHLLCWVAVLKFYAATSDSVDNVITLKAASALSDTVLNHKVNPGDIKYTVNHWDVTKAGGDEWCKEVMSEIGKNVWDKNCNGEDIVYVSEPCIQLTGSGRLYVTP